MEEPTYWGLSAHPCGACRSTGAQLFCRTCDSRSHPSYICRTCDSRAHSSHSRVPLCEVCERGPAVVTCRADAAALCVTCDSDIHSANPLASRHVRVPISPFISAVDSSLHEPFSAAELFGEDEEGSEAEAATWLMQDGPYEGVERGAQQTVSVAEPLDEKKSSYSPAYYYPEQSMTHSVSSSDAGVVPDSTAQERDRTTVCIDREARLMRYREKRKNRRFEKTIRYASRKAYAETRPRIKGRFVKRAEVESEVGEIYTSAAAAVAALITDADYGVVPSF